MTTGRAIIVVDGLIEIAPELVQKFRVRVLPRKVFIDGTELTVDRKSPLAAVNDRLRNSGFRHPKVVAASPYHYSTYYQRYIKRKRRVLSAHLPYGFDSSIRLARHAQSLLSSGEEYVHVYSLPALDLGAGFLIQKVAEFSYDNRASLRQTLLFLQRLETFIHTILITNPADVGLPYVEKPQSWLQRQLMQVQGLKRLSVLDKLSGNLHVIGHFPQPLAEFKRLRPLMRETSGPYLVLTKTTISPGVSSSDVKMALTGGLKAKVEAAMRPRPPGLEASFLPRSFTEICLAPGSEEVSNATRWALELRD